MDFNKNEDKKDENLENNAMEYFVNSGYSILKEERITELTNCDAELVKRLEKLTHVDKLSPVSLEETFQYTEEVDKYIDKARDVMVHFSAEDYKEVWSLIEKLQAKIKLFKDLRSNLNNLYQEIPAMTERDVIGIYVSTLETNKRLVIEREILDARAFLNKNGYYRKEPKELNLDLSPEKLRKNSPVDVNKLIKEREAEKKQPVTNNKKVSNKMATTKKSINLTKYKEARSSYLKEMRVLRLELKEALEAGLTFSFYKKYCNNYYTNKMAKLHKKYEKKYGYQVTKKLFNDRTVLIEENNLKNKIESLRKSIRKFQNTKVSLIEGNTCKISQIVSLDRTIFKEIIKQIPKKVEILENKMLEVATNDKKAKTENILKHGAFFAAIRGMYKEGKRTKKINQKRKEKEKLAQEQVDDLEVVDLVNDTEVIKEETEVQDVQENKIITPIIVPIELKKTEEVIEETSKIESTVAVNDSIVEATEIVSKQEEIKETEVVETKEEIIEVKEEVEISKPVEKEVEVLEETVTEQVKEEAVELESKPIKAVVIEEENNQTEPNEQLVEEVVEEQDTEPVEVEETKEENEVKEKSFIEKMKDKLTSVKEKVLSKLNVKKVLWGAFGSLVVLGMGALALNSCQEEEMPSVTEQQTDLDDEQKDYTFDIDSLFNKTEQETEEEKDLFYDFFNNDEEEETKYTGFTELLNGIKDIEKSEEETEVEPSTEVESEEVEEIIVETEEETIVEEEIEVESSTETESEETEESIVEHEENETIVEPEIPIIDPSLEDEELETDSNNISNLEVSEFIEYYSQPFTLVEGARTYSNMYDMSDDINSKKPSYDEEANRWVSRVIFEVEGTPVYVSITNEEKIAEYLEMGADVLGFSATNEFSKDQNGNIDPNKIEGYYSQDSVLVKTRN